MRLVPPAIRHLLKEYARIKKKSLNFVKLKLSGGTWYETKGNTNESEFWRENCGSLRQYLAHYFFATLIYNAEKILERLVTQCLYFTSIELFKSINRMFQPQLYVLLALVFRCKPFVKPHALSRLMLPLIFQESGLR